MENQIKIIKYQEKVYPSLCSEDFINQLECFGARKEWINALKQEYNFKLSWIRNIFEFLF
jgi:hypothetical protein